MTCISFPSWSCRGHLCLFCVVCLPFCHLCVICVLCLPFVWQAVRRTFCDRFATPSVVAVVYEPSDFGNVTCFAVACHAGKMCTPYTPSSARRNVFFGAERISVSNFWIVQAHARARLYSRLCTAGARGVSEICCKRLPPGDLFRPRTASSRKQPSIRTPARYPSAWGLRTPSPSCAGSRGLGPGGGGLRSAIFRNFLQFIALSCNFPAILRNFPRFFRSWIRPPQTAIPPPFLSQLLPPRRRLWDMESDAGAPRCRGGRSVRFIGRSPNRWARCA